MVKSFMILVYKPLGATPLQAIKSLKRNDPRLSNKTLSYAGRLDPMAEGLLMVLVGDENKKRREFEHFDKEYEFEALLGIRTDSYDLLGIPEIGKPEQNYDTAQFIEKNTGKISQKYPPYSSFRIKGKPLYWWTRRGEAPNIPEREIEVKEFVLLGKSQINSSALLETVYSRIKLIKGDFRQDEIYSEWEKLIKKSNRKSFQILKFRIKCSSGSYVRSIVDSMGESLQTHAVTFSIKRTHIGSFDLSSAFHLDEAA